MVFILILETLIQLAHALRALYEVISAARSNPEITIALSIVLLAGVAAYGAIRFFRRHPSSFPTLR